LMQKGKIKRKLPELWQLEQLIARTKHPLTVHEEAIVEVSEHRLPLYSIEMLPYRPGLPTVIISAGVHGLERIGTQVLLSYLEMLLSRIGWDVVTAKQLDEMNLVFLPIVNPGGMYLNTRANPNGVDLMRNSPMSAEGKPLFMGGGQRMTRHLPWFCGYEEGKMERESQVLVDVVERYSADSPFTLTLDCHSGFGMNDYLWFPYAYRKRPIAVLDKIYALKLLLDRTYSHHHYTFEPQSLSYVTHGDLWDYIYKRHKNTQDSMMIPLTLEMGSWNWIKKHPIQALSAAGLFNPMVPHRLQRVLRRHIMLFEFLCSAAIGYKTWMPKKKQRAQIFQAANQFWYR
jgi:Zinc carboxypeptidase